jgi:hypothetical protein
MIFYAKDHEEMCQWSLDIDTQCKLYTDSKRKTAGETPHARTHARPGGVPYLCACVTQNRCRWQRHVKQMTWLSSDSFSPCSQRQSMPLILKAERASTSRTHTHAHACLTGLLTTPARSLLYFAAKKGTLRS